LTETGGALTPTGFTVTATAEGAPEINQSAAGSLTVRNAFVQVTSVTPSPSFTNPGGLVDVSARILNITDNPLPAQAFYTVSDANGNIVFTSTPVSVPFTAFASFPTVDLGEFNTTGLAEGSYTINVMVTDSSGNPLTNVIGQSSVVIGSPVTASLSVSPTTIYLSTDAAGYGWFIDTLPHTNAANPSASLSGHEDLLTVLMHELGHTLGLNDLNPAKFPDDLMTETLATDVQRMPSALDVMKVIGAKSNSISAVSVQAVPVKDALSHTAVSTLQSAEPLMGGLATSATTQQYLVLIVALVSEEVGTSGSNSLAGTFTTSSTDPPETVVDPQRTDIKSHPASPNGTLGFGDEKNDEPRDTGTDNPFDHYA
jgi:hypothetical protein